MNKTIIKAEVVAHSKNQQGDELVSLSITFPRMILAEINKHRMLSSNTSSSRTIPFKKMVEAVQNDPFIPIAWQKHHSGMQGTEYITEQSVVDFKKGVWLKARNKAIQSAEELYYPVRKAKSIYDIEELKGTGVTKQLCNRLLEPFMWTTMLITGSKEGWDNFFRLRCPAYKTFDGLLFKSKKDFVNYNQDKGISEWSINDYTDLEWLQINKGQAEIHIMDLAEKIYDAMNESNPKELKSGEWHIPFEDKIQLAYTDYDSNGIITNEGINKKVKISTAMAARTSYTMVGDEKEINYERMVELHDRLIKMRHDSPLEHCARAMSDEEYESFIKGNIDIGFDIPKEAQGWCTNIKGFIPYRYMIDNNLKM